MGFMNRQGDNAPKDTHPFMMQKIGKSRVNYTQMVPYQSKEMHDPQLAPVFRRLKVVFAEVFEWISQKVGALPIIP